MHNLRNPRCTAYTKCRVRQSDKPLKSCHINHLLWSHGSSLTFVTGTLTDHFSRENDQYSLHDRHDRDDRIDFDRFYARRKPIRARIGSIGPTCARDCAWPCTCADRQSQFLCMHRCTHAQNGFADSLKQTVCTLFHGHSSIDVISSTPMRCDSFAELFSIAANCLKFLCTKNRNHVHNSAA
jgi:hypothetical protein